MADINPQVDIDKLHADILAAVKAQFPDFKTVEFYRDDEAEVFPLPACLLAMSEPDPLPDSDNGTGQWPLLLRFEAHIVMGHTSPATRINVRKAALAMATWLYQRGRFAPCDPTQVIACEPDEFAPQADKFQIWRVEFVMRGYLGQTAWNNDGTVPTDVVYSWSPAIGTGNEGAYTPVLDGPP